MLICKLKFTTIEVVNAFTTALIAAGVSFTIWQDEEFKVDKQQGKFVKFQYVKLNSQDKYP
jgi:hypothetical protein